MHLYEGEFIDSGKLCCSLLIRCLISQRIIACCINEKDVRIVEVLDTFSYMYIHVRTS